MNLIIMGESRSGKTMLANLICSKVAGYSKISVDYLAMTFKKTFPELNLDFYKKDQSNHGEFLQNYFEHLIYKDNNCGIYYVLEGGKLSDETVLWFKKLKNTKVIFLGKTEISPQDFFNEIRAYEKSLSTGGWTKRLDNNTLLSWCTDWINKSKQNKKFCEENDILFVDTSKNQKQVLDNILKLIKSK